MANYILKDDDNKVVDECADCDYSQFDYTSKKWICISDDPCDAALSIKHIKENRRRKK